MSTITKAPTVLVDEERVSDVLVGRWTADEGGALRTSYRMEVDFGLRRYTGERQTIDHETITEWWDFTASGGIYRNGGEDSFGQNLERLRLIQRPESPWTRADIRSLRMIWERWHLNDMRPECAHLERQFEPHPQYGYPQLKLDGEGTVCPVSGYKMGRSWLVEPLPDEVITEVRRLLALARGDA